MEMSVEALYASCIAGVVLLFVLGGVIGYFVAAYRTAKPMAELQTETERLKTALETETARRDEYASGLQEMKSRYDAQSAELNSARAAAVQYKTSLESEKQQRESLEKSLHELRNELQSLNGELSTSRAETAHFKTALQSEQQYRATETARIKDMQEKHFAQFRTLAGEILEQNANKLKDTNKENMDGLLKPLREQLTNLGKAVHDTNVASAENKASLESAIKHMMEKTENLSKDAENLALALKGDSKKQGDWGEMVLERMLEDSGLRKGEEYYVQSNFKTEEGANVRPDVVIRFPDNRCIVVDSKVSLTAYAQYMAATNEEERYTYLNAHVASVRKHIDELAAKDYAAVVEDTISYVLMFMPNEASYMAALQAAPSLPTDAYRRKIILISPTNLLMALQLAYNLWQKERQSRNVEAIFSRATMLYEKLVSVQDSFENVGKALSNAQQSYDTALGQFCKGRGHFAGQVQKLLDMGITPRKKLRLDEETEA